MRLAVFSDLHICLSQRFREGQRVHTAMAAELALRASQGVGPDLILLDGDLYERTPNPEEVMEAVRLLLLLGDIGPVVIIRGNHDPRHAIDVFACLQTRYPITVYDQPAVHAFPGGALAVLPWLDHVGPPPDRRMTAEARIAARGAALVEILDKLGAELRQHEGVRLAASHCVIRGAKTSVGQPLKKGQEFEVGLDDLGRIGADAYVLGHIHLAQSWFIGAAPVLYIGSTTRTSFGEVEEKRIVMLHAPPGGPVRVETIRTPAAPMFLSENGWMGHGWETDPEALTAAVAAACAVAAPGVAPEVRFLYKVAAEHREAAKLAASALAAKLEAVGAVVNAKPVLMVTRTARCPEIAGAPALADKLTIFLEEVRSIPPSDLRAVRALAALAELEATLAIRKTAQAGGVRLRSVRLAGFGIFKDEVSLDLDQIPGPIIAVEGENGHGKSTLCGAWGAGMYRKVATDHGTYPIARYMTAPDGFLETVVDVDGAPFRLYQDLGAETAHVYRPDGTVVDERGMRSSFDRWVADNLLPREVRQAAFDAVQADPGIIGARKGVRKRLFLQALGAGVLTRVGKEARARTNKESEILRAAGDRLEDRRRDAAAYPVDVEVQIDAARAALVAAEREHAAARAAAAAHATAASACAAAEARRTEHREARARLDRLLAQRAALRETIAAGSAIREAAAQIAEIDAAIGVGAQAVHEAGARAEAFDRDAARAGRDAVAARGRAEVHRRTAARARGHLAARERVEAAAAAIPAYRATVEELEVAAEAAARAVLAAEQARGLLDAFERDATRAARDAAAARGRAAAARAAQARAVSTLTARPTVLAAVDDGPRLRRVAEDAEAAIVRAEAALTALRADTDRSGAGRLKALLLALQYVRGSETIDAAHTIAAWAIAADEDVERATNGEAMAVAAQKARTVREAARAARAAVGAAEILAVQAPALERAEQERIAAVAALAVEEAAAAAAESERAALAEKSTAGRTEADARIGAVTASAVRARAELETARRALAAAQAIAADAPVVARAAEELGIAEAAAAAEDTAAAGAGAEQEASLVLARGARTEGEQVRERLGLLHRDRAPLAATADQVDALVRAEAGVGALASPIAAAEAFVASTIEAEAELPLVPSLDAGLVARAASDERAAASTLARLEEQGGRARALRDEVVALEEAVAAARDAVATWDLLAQAFGPDGIQALEIDAACPALSEIATGYLHKHFGPRWTIRVDTREDEDGGADEDGGDEGAGVLNITVYDAATGRKQDILFYSPGERAFLGRAFAGALAFMVGNRTGAREPTMILDETACAVSPQNIQPYMGMIRGIAEDIGASRVILVVQSPPLAALADSVIRVVSGTLSVHDPSDP